MKATTGRISLRMRVGAVLAAGAALGFLILAAIPVISGTFGSSPAVTLPDPDERLAEATLAAPYSVKLPAALPPGATLQHVEWDATQGVVVIDVWWKLSDGARLHVWQTNSSSPIESIPPGDVVRLEGRSWSAVTVEWSEKLTQLSTRFSDGVTLTLDAPMDSLSSQQIAEVAGSIS